MVEYKYDALRIIGIALTTSSVTELGFRVIFIWNSSRSKYRIRRNDVICLNLTGGQNIWLLSLR